MDVTAEHDRSTGSGQTNGSGALLATLFGAGGVVVVCLARVRSDPSRPGRRPVRVGTSAPGMPPTGLSASGWTRSAPSSSCRCWSCPPWRPFTAATICSPTAAGNRSASSWFFFNTFVAGMVMVVIARTALLFLCPGR